MDAITVGNNSFINAFLNTQPSLVKGPANTDTSYHKRKLWELIFSQFDFQLPEGWKHNWFRYWLFQFGSIGIFYCGKKFGWLPLPFSSLRLDVQYNPILIQSMAGNLFQPVKGIVGINAAYIHILDDFFGLNDTVTHYAEQLAAFDKAIQVNLMNTAIGVYIEVDDPKAGQDVKRAYQKASQGEPMVVVKKNTISKNGGFNTMLPDVRNNYLAGELLNARRQIYCEFLTAIGIQNANTEKKERLITSEVEANAGETKALVSLMLDNINRDLLTVQEVTGLTISCKGRWEDVRNNTNGIL